MGETPLRRKCMTDDVRLDRHSVGRRRQCRNLPFLLPQPERVPALLPRIAPLSLPQSRLCRILFA